MVGDGQISLCLKDGTTLTRALHRIRHGNDAAFVVGELTEAGAALGNPQLLELLKEIERLDRLALASPRRSRTIVTAILEGRAPPRLTNRFLQNLDGLPLCWTEQESLLLG